jgi:hypothetical protein
MYEMCQFIDQTGILFVGRGNFPGIVNEPFRACTAPALPSILRDENLISYSFSDRGAKGSGGLL